MNENEIILQNPEDGMSKTLQIRNSTIDFLVFTKQNSQDSIEVRVQDENVWLTQDGIARLLTRGVRRLPNICRRFSKRAS